MRGELTEDGRRRISAAARRSKPSEHSTGPRTLEGKARSRMNALKDDGEEVGVHDAFNRAMRALVAPLRRLTAMESGGPVRFRRNEPARLPTEADIKREVALVHHILTMPRGTGTDELTQWHREHRELRRALELREAVRVLGEIVGKLQARAQDSAIAKTN